MKITIDTKEDSQDEIKKVISLLQNLLSNEDLNSGGVAPAESSDLFSMFGNDNASETPQEPVDSVLDSDPASIPEEPLQEEEDAVPPQIEPY